MTDLSGAGLPVSAIGLQPVQSLQLGMRGPLEAAQREIERLQVLLFLLALTLYMLMDLIVLVQHLEHWRPSFMHACVSVGECAKGLHHCMQYLGRAKHCSMSDQDTSEKVSPAWNVL